MGQPGLDVNSHIELISIWPKPVAKIQKEPTSPSCFDSVVRAQASELKSLGFNSGQGHIPWLLARSLNPIGACAGGN